jgi:hypothetical protein
MQNGKGYIWRYVPLMLMKPLHLRQFTSVRVVTCVVRAVTRSSVEEPILTSAHFVKATNRQVLQWTLAALKMRFRKTDMTFFPSGSMVSLLF